MASKVQSIVEADGKGLLIDIECHISNGLPSIVIVGFANKAVDEAKERLRSALVNAHLELPRKRITINLAPADVPKDSSSFDLAIAVAILAGSGQIASDKSSKSVFIGELALDGSIRPVRGIIGKLLAAREHGIINYFIPTANLKQAMLVPGIQIWPAKHLRDIYLHFTKKAPIKQVEARPDSIKPPRRKLHESDFAHIVGQKRAKRALEIAAAGAHNVLLNGPPGTGKSMLAKALPSILPALNQEEILEVTHLHSLANKQYDTIVYERPFRSPHHSSSETSIIGGGQTPKPGEISLSHKGVLFLDELPEFKRSAIEALRQPLEDRVITVARARDSITFPANFILVATSNPCPCGNYGSSNACTCSPQQIIKYQRKMSGPILDRIDMYVDVDEILHEKLLSDEDQEKSLNIRERVHKARVTQARRYGTANKTNADMSNQEIKKLAQLTEAAQTLLNQAATKLELSARNYMRCIKVARTIADLENSEYTDVPHISEALQYRRRPVVFL